MHRTVAFCLLATAILNASILVCDRAVADDKSSPEALAMYADAANFQNNGAFELAVEEWAKFVEKYPNDPLSPKARHYLGVCSIQTKEYDKAIQAFQAVITKYPKFENLEEAYLNLGWCRFTLAGQSKPELYPQAAEALAQMIEKFPNGKLIDQALYFLGESYYALGKKSEAVAAYDRLIKDHPKSNLRCEGVYALGVTQEELEKWREAGTTYDLFLKECSASPLMAEVRMRKAETVLQLGDAANAERMFAALATEKDFASADHALFRQAFCLSKQEKFLDAAGLFTRLTTTFPNSTHVAEATISAGRNYLRGGNLEEAATWLRKSVELSGEYAPEAAHWLCRVYLKTKQNPQVVELVESVLPKVGDGPFRVPLQMDAADALYELTDWREDAVARYLKIAAEHPQHELAAQALYNAAFGFLELRKFSEAIEHAEAFVKRYPSAVLLPDARYVQAESLLLAGKLPEAEQAFRELVRGNAGHADLERWKLRLGAVLLRAKNYDALQTYLTAELPSIKLPDNVAEAQFLIGSSQFLLEKHAEALAALNASLAANPKWRQADEATLLLARTQQKLKRFPEAKALVAKFFAEFPESKLSDQAYYRQGEILYAAEDFAGAATAYDQVLTKHAESPFVPYALYGKGWARMQAKDMAGANQAFGELLSKHAKHALESDTLFARCMSRRQSGEFAGAVADANAFLAANPQGERVAGALYERGLAEIGLKDFPAAIATLNKLLQDFEQYPQADQVLYELGWVHKSQQQSAEAIAAFGKLVSRFPDSPLAPEAHYHLGEDHYEKKAYAEAAREYGHAKQKSKTADLTEKAVYKLGWTNFQLKQYPAAAAEFTNLLRDFPQGPLRSDGAFMRGESLFKQDQYADALPAFQEASSGKLSSPQMETLAILRIGQCLGQLKRWQESLDQLDQLAKKFPESPYLAEALYEQGWARQNLGKSDQAYKDYEQAATLSRDHVGARARFMMGEIQFEKKQFDEAIKQFQRVMFGFGGDNATPEVKLWQAKAGHEAGRCAEVQIQATTDVKRKSQLTGDARRYYEYVAAKHPQDNLAAEAKKRLETLKRL